MSARRIVALTLNLPQQSRTMRALGGTDAEWTTDRTLLGLIIERLDALHYTYIKSQSGKARKPVEIVPRPKPGKRPRPAAQSTLSVLSALDERLAVTG